MLFFAQTDIATSIIAAVGTILVAVIPLWLKLRHDQHIMDKKFRQEQTIRENEQRIKREDEQRINEEKFRQEQMMRESEIKKSQIEQDLLQTEANQLENQIVSTLTQLNELAARVSQLESKLSASQRVVSEPPKQPAQLSKEYFLFRNGEAVAKGEVAGGGIKVHKDSFIMPDEKASISRSASRLRSELLEKGVLAKRGDQIIFTDDHCFDNPSSAAGVILGIRENGLRAWKDADGRALSDKAG